MRIFMKKKLMPLLLLSGAMLLAACGQTSSSTTSSADSSQTQTSTQDSSTQSSIEEKGYVLNVSITATEDWSLSNEEYAKFSVDFYVGGKKVEKAEENAQVVARITIAEGATFRIGKVQIIGRAGENKIDIDYTPDEANRAYAFKMPKAQVIFLLKLDKIPDLSMSPKDMKLNEARTEFSDGTFTSAYHKDSKAEETSFKVGGGSEITASKNLKTITFTSAKPGLVRIRWKAGSKETTRTGYFIQASETGEIGQVIGLAPFSLDEAGNAAWRTDKYVIPAAGKYYLAFNASAAVSMLNVYYDETKSQNDVAPVAEDMGEPYRFDASRAIITSENGFAQEHAIGKYTFSAGVVGRSYGKIEYDDGDGKIPHYSVYELSDGETMKFASPGAGTLSILLTGRNPKGEDGTAKDSKLTCTDAEGKKIGFEDGVYTVPSSEVNKKIYSASVLLGGAEATYTFTAEGKVAIYLAEFDAI